MRRLRFIRTGFWSGDQGRRGAVAVLVGLMLVGIIGFVSIGTEVVLLLLTASQMRAAADAGALAAVTAQLRGFPVNYTTEALAQAAAAGFVNGQSGTSVTVNSPPASGNYTGTATAVEVLIAQPQTLALANAVYSGPFTVRARAVANLNPGGACALVLNTTGSSMSVAGNAVANFVNCDLAVNSSAANAVTVGGGATLGAHRVFIAGGYSLAGGGYINATSGITTQSATIANPYANYTVPAFGGCQYNNYAPKGNPPPASPGVYCNGFSLNSGTALVMNPGVYFIDRGTFSLSGGASLSGTGVTIILTSSTGANYATVAIAGGATLNLSAPTTGATAGFAFFQDPRAPSSGTDDLSGGGSIVITGALYFPSQSVKYSGGGSATVSQCTQIVALNLTLVGNSTLSANCYGSGVTPIGKGGNVVLVE